MKERSCPECGHKKMMKAGWGWSGKNRVQRFRCGACGKVTQKKNQ